MRVSKRGGGCGADPLKIEDVGLVVGQGHPVAGQGGGKTWRAKAGPEFEQGLPLFFRRGGEHEVRQNHGCLPEFYPEGEAFHICEGIFSGKERFQIGDLQ